MSEEEKNTNIQRNHRRFGLILASLLFFGLGFQIAKLMDLLVNYWSGNYREGAEQIILSSVGSFIFITAAFFVAIFLFFYYIPPRLLSSFVNLDRIMRDRLVFRCVLAGISIFGVSVLFTMLGAQIAQWGVLAIILAMAYFQFSWVNNLVAAND